MKPHRRTYLKGLHGILVMPAVWFTLTQRGDIRALGPAAFMFHCVLGLTFVTPACSWTADQLERPLASRPGPKVRPRPRHLHTILHRAPLCRLFGVAVTRFLSGLTAQAPLRA